MVSNRIDSDSVVDLILHLKWQSYFAVHTDAFQATRVNIWRDILPPKLLKALEGRAAGDAIQVDLDPADAVSTFVSQNLFDIRTTQFNQQFRPDTVTKPRLGRFYPQGILKGIAGIYKENIQPFRCVGVNNGHMTVDLNHPLADKSLHLSVVIGKVERKAVERGGTSIDWMERLASGPGMQARWQQQPTDYFSASTYRRDDEQADAEFYRQPRLVHHIDATAREMVKNTYGRFLTNGMHILDLMSSWESHLPTNITPTQVVGLGLNTDELSRNPQLSRHTVHDLNRDPILPFGDSTFDAVVNTVSVEYLTDPVTVFREVLRVLRPEGYFLVTFSNRWFPTKAIRIWAELHEFERMGLVLEYFLRAGGFRDLNTYSMRGLPRPHDDPYAPDHPYSDPIYAVWGRRA